MVKEWGMSDRIGPMAWESHQHVFLGEDLMQGAREYSDDTARLVDEETSRILREQEDRARQLLTHHRRGLDLVARALLDEETVEGAKVVALVAQGLSEQQPVPGLPVSHPSQLAGHPTQLASHPTQLASGTTAPGGPLPPPAV
jgi:cell division protease FtsH